MGAGIEAFGQAGGIGVQGKRALRMGDSGVAFHRSFRRVSGRLAMARSIESDAPVEAVRDALEFSDEDRREAEG